MKSIKFMYDFGSPNAYLAHKVLPGIQAKTGAVVVFNPILLGGVFKSTNNQSPIMAFAGVTGKLAYQHKEIARFIKRHNIALNWNPHFPINTISLMRGAVFAVGKPWERLYIDTVFDAMWLEGLNMAAPDIFAASLAAADLPIRDILAAIQTPDIKTALMTATQAAVDLGVFGVPTMWVGDEMFFGKDALSDMEYEIAQPE